NFIRIHRSYIAAVDEIKNLELFEKESYRITLKDAKQLPVSKNGYEKLREILF
ncbi:MAG: DNA-binding response regulator, partial [Ignavibacteria bacterium CG_4_9_14_3_um_filter_36_18]